MPENEVFGQAGGGNVMALNKKEYQTISVYKFMLCILVVFLHNKTSDDYRNISSIMQKKSS